MKYTYLPLEKENDLNKILRVQKSKGNNIHILFHSLWDKNSMKLVDLLNSKCKKSTKYSEPVYGVDSFNMPHSFVIFNTSLAPALVSVERGKVIVEDYLASIYKKLRL